MIPVGGALESTGAAGRIADLALAASSQFPPVAALVLLMVATMMLSDVINNAAAAVLMAPIALRLAAGLDASADPFLMAVALGASGYDWAFVPAPGRSLSWLSVGTVHATVVGRGPDLLLDALESLGAGRAHAWKSPECRSGFTSRSVAPPARSP
jgi:H+/gluconate symporter-like permease